MSKDSESDLDQMISMVKQPHREFGLDVVCEQGKKGDLWLEVFVNGHKLCEVRKYVDTGEIKEY